ncbi:MAG TPA: diacylglycerol kinase family protein, partial [Candidatus Nanopelagicales bacterium]|nr:diacylglycerol kinase family protein [Candidatus Nanopelagicales bacterium]
DRSLSEQLVRAPAVLLACGGDGTVHQALQHVVGTGIPLAIAPFGTGNDSANCLGLPADPVAVAETVAAARADPRRYVRIVDTGQVVTADGQERAFLAVLSSGFDSVVNVRANAMTWPRGRARYLRAILAELTVFTPVRYEVTLDRGLPGERSFARRGMLVAVGNGPSYGGGMRVCPAARLDDGLLDVTFLAELPIRTFLRVFPTVYRGTHVRRSEVLTATARTVELAAAGQVAFADGEPVGPLPVTVRARPRSLRVVAGHWPAPTLGP